MSFEKLTEKFNLVPIDMTSAVPEKVSESETVASSTPEDDAEFTRKSIRESVMKSEEILAELLRIGKQTESARTFEVAIQAARAMADGAMQLAKTHEAEQKAKNPRPTNMNVFVGSTKDLLRAIQRESKAAEDAQIQDAEISTDE